MTTTMRGSKVYVQQVLNKARQTVLIEQDKHLEVINEAASPDARKAFTPEIQAKGWKSVLQAMKGCLYPPQSEERRKYLNLGGYDDELAYLKLKTIADKDIRHQVYHLNSLIEYTQRMGALATWYERVGTLQNRGSSFFHFWAQVSSLRILQDEAIQLGKLEEAETIQSLASAFNKAAEMLFDTPWDQEMAERAANILERMVGMEN